MAKKGKTRRSIKMAPQVQTYPRPRPDKIIGGSLAFKLARGVGIVVDGGNANSSAPFQIPQGTERDFRTGIKQIDGIQIQTAFQKSASQGIISRNILRPFADHGT